MTKNSSDIIEEVKQNIKPFTWERLYQLKKATGQMSEDYYVIFNWGDKTRIDCPRDYYKLVTTFDNRKKRKVLLISKKMFEKLSAHIKYLLRSGCKEQAHEIGNELNKLYPDFNFFDL